MAYKPRPDIYTRLLNELILTDEHRKSLKEKRGFTDQTIDTLKFKSALPENDKIVKKFIDYYGSGSMFECSLVDEDSKTVFSLTKPELIIIPYMDNNKDVYYYKSHKQGNLPNSGVMPYSVQTCTVDRSSKTIILCESEFKAAGMYQMGWNALGLGGISTFSGKALPNLLKFLEGFTDIIILFDTEIQDNPELKTHKPDFRGRYWQYIYSYVMAHRILKSKDNVTVRIASLPMSWTIDGKADIDSCIAAGKTKSDFEIVLKSALFPTVYRDRMQIPEKHQHWVNRKIESLCLGAILEDVDNCYYVNATRKMGGEFVTVPKQISNFKINVIGTYRHAGEIRRKVQLYSKYKEKSEMFFLTAQQMSSPGKFKETVLSKGDYMFNGTDKDFLLLIENMFLDTDAYPIDIIDMIGRNEDFKCWFFSNIMFLDDGTEILVKDGEFKHEDLGWRLNKLSSRPLPSLYLKDDVKPKQILDAFYAAWGFPGIVALAYSISNIFANPVFNKYNMFPFALIYGEKDSGKSTLSDSMVFLYGFSANDAAMNMAETTATAITRKLSYYSSLPCRFDEYRQGEKKIDDKSSILRSIYNRQSASKGIKDPFGIREVEPKGTFIMIGEQKPTDPALASRCVPIYLSRNNRTADTYNAIRWLHDNNTKMSYLVYNILKKYKEHSKTFIESMEATRKSLQGLSIQQEPRTQLHYAMLMAALGVAFEKEDILQYQHMMIKEMTTTLDIVASDSALFRFFYDIETMISMGEDVYKYVAKSIDTADEGVMYFPAVYQCWCKFKQNRGGVKGIYEQSTLKQYIESQKYVVSPSSERFLGELNVGISVPCFVFDLNSPFIPVPLKNLIKKTSTYARKK